MATEASTKYCSNCGEELGREAEYCTSCGVGLDGQAGEEKTRFSQRGYTVFGVLTGLIALILFPPVFGIASILSGVQLFRHYDERYGMAIMIWGGVTLVIGVLFGMYMWGG